MDVRNHIQETNKIKYLKYAPILKIYQMKEINVHLPFEVGRPLTKQSSNKTIRDKTFHILTTL